VRSTFLRAALAALLATALFATTSGGVDAAPKVRSSSPVDGTDWSCRPSRAHPNPVVMLHGLTGTSEGNWTYLAPQLVANGYCVFTLTFGRVSPDIDLGGMGPIAQSAQEVGDFIGRVRAATGAARVDIVGHSEGGFIGLYVPKVLGLSGVVGRVVALAPPTHGTTVSGLTDFADFFGVRPLLDYVLRVFGCQACADALPGSATVAALNAGPIAQPGVDYTIVATNYDVIVTPTGASFVPEAGVHNLNVQDVCPYDTVGHIGLALDPSVLGIVLNALDPAHAGPVACWFGPPI
jgi:triacylglycerol esterase/lipase EstA (alpha/beta hydrolase family)